MSQSPSDPPVVAGAPRSLRGPWVVVVVLAVVSAAAGGLIAGLLLVPTGNPAADPILTATPSESATDSAPPSAAGGGLHAGTTSTGFANAPGSGAPSSTGTGGTASPSPVDPPKPAPSITPLSPANLSSARCQQPAGIEPVTVSWTAKNAERVWIAVTVSGNDPSGGVSYGDHPAEGSTTVNYSCELDSMLVTFSFGSPGSGEPVVAWIVLRR